MATTPASSLSQIKAPQGGFQNGGWYWDASAGAARQFINGSFSDPNTIHPSSTQQGAGQTVSPQVQAQSEAAQGVNPATTPTSGNSYADLLSSLNITDPNQAAYAAAQEGVVSSFTNLAA